MQRVHAGGRLRLLPKSSWVTVWVHPPHPASQASAIVGPPIFRMCRHAVAADMGRAGGVVKGSAANEVGVPAAPSSLIMNRMEKIPSTGSSSVYLSLYGLPVDFY